MIQTCLHKIKHLLKEVRIHTQAWYILTTFVKSFLTTDSP